jgi:hypothetical protein
MKIKISIIYLNIHHKYVIKLNMNHENSFIYFLNKVLLFSIEIHDFYLIIKKLLKHYKKNI